VTRKGLNTFVGGQTMTSERDAYLFGKTKSLHFFARLKRRRNYDKLRIGKFLREIARF